MMLRNFASAASPLGDQNILIGEAAAHLQLTNSLPRQEAQRGLLLGGEMPRHAVYDAEGAEGKAVGRDQGGAGIEADIGGARHQRVVGKPRIRLGIRDFEHMGLKNGVRAKGSIAGSLARVEADNAFKPLALGVNQRNGSDGNPADLRCEAGDVVKIIVRGRVQYPALTQGRKPRFFRVG